MMQLTADRTVAAPRPSREIAPARKPDGPILGEGVGTLRMMRWVVVVTCHNYGPLLADAIMSAFRAIDADGGDGGVVVVDDASTDETPEVCERLVAAYWPRLMTLRNGSGAPFGPSAARNAGLAQVSARYVVFLDADDKLGPDYLAEAGQILDAGEADVVYPDQHAFGALCRHQPSLPEWGAPLAYEVNTVVVSAAMRRSLWARVGGFDESFSRHGEDWELWLRCLAAGARFRHLRGLHFFRRVHPAQRSKVDDAAFAAAMDDLRERHPALAPTEVCARWRRDVT